MKKAIAVFLLGGVLIGCNEQKTAYVDTTRLIQEYSKMESIEAEFNDRSQELRSELEAAAGDFQKEVRTYQENMGNMTQAQREQTEKELMEKQQMLQQQQQTRSGQLREESDLVVDSLVQNVREFVKEYGEENNYTYIFGSNESANIMFAEEGLDITDEVLEELNDNVANGN